MRRPRDRALFLRPAERVEAQRGPMQLGFAAGIHSVLEPEQTQMSGLMRTKAGDFDVITQQVRILRNLVVLAGEKLFLVIETRPPRQIAADFQVFAKAVANHVRRVDALGGIGVVRATRRVNVVIAGPPAELRWIDPAINLECDGFGAWADNDRLLSGDGLRAAPEFHAVDAVGQLDLFSVATIDLRMDCEVGREALRLRRINAQSLIADKERRRRRLVVFV